MYTRQVVVTIQGDGSNPDAARKIKNVALAANGGNH